MKLRVTILGSGSSGGVPRLGGADGAGNWGECDPKEPRNKRTRCSVLVQREHREFGFQHDKVTSVLVDTSPDMRQQLLNARCSRLDGVLYTHDHADQVHGIDDLRMFALAQRSRVPVYIDQHTAGGVATRFDYCFKQREGSFYPPILDLCEMPPAGAIFTIDGPSGEIPVIAFLQDHGSVDSLGFRFGDIAYSSDVVGLSEESFDMLAGAKVWILDALQRKPHGTHVHLARALEWIHRIGPDRGILTNLHVTMDYQTLKQELPAHIEPAYDGMVIELSGV